MHAGMGDKAMMDVPGGEPMDSMDNTAKRTSRAGEASDDVLGEISAAGIGSSSSSESDCEGRLWYKAAELSDSDNASPQSSSDSEPSGEETTWDPYLEARAESAIPTGAPSGEEEQLAEPNGLSRKRRRHGSNEPRDWDLLDISFMPPDKLEGEMAKQGDHVLAVKAQGLWLWKIQFATMPTEERQKLEGDLTEELQGRSMAECIKIFRRNLQEYEAELFHTFLLDLLRKRLLLSTSTA